MDGLQEMPQCSKCKQNFTPTYKRNGDAKKSCNICLVKYNKYKMYTCEHGHNKYCCLDCGGSSTCEHKRQRRTCMDCGGSAICEHRRIRTQCKACDGTFICEHGLQRPQCKKCTNSLDVTINHMVSNSKLKDKKYNRYNEDNFITRDYVRGLVDQSMNLCCYCNNPVQYLTHDSTLATIERIDNNIGHIIGNCKIACLQCNVRRVGSKEIHKYNPNL